MIDVFRYLQVWTISHCWSTFQ